MSLRTLYTLSTLRRPRTMRRMMVTSAMGASALGALVALEACAPVPKPAALVSYEDLHRDPRTEVTRKQFPDLVASAEQLGQRAEKEWQSNNLDDSTRAALTAEIKLKTALARYDQAQSRARLQAIKTEQAEADLALTEVEKDLGATTEQIKLMQQLSEARQAANEEKQRLAAQMSSQQQKTEQLSNQLTTEKKRTEAQVAVRTAETVDAAKYAAPEYGAATNMLAKADVEISQGNWQGAQASLEVARKSAEKATEIAKPIYEQAERATASKARDESLARDAAALPGVAVRIEPNGELQRLIISLGELFTRQQTTLEPGKDESLSPVAALISKYPSYPIQVIGHTDNRGRAGELIALSQARAQSVFSALVAKGVEAKRILVSGQGPNAPIADNKVAAGRKKNNRVEIIFLYH
jgi:outer membrane protein OmpA-like peptidoglycan-associated protein